MVAGAGHPPHLADPHRRLPGALRQRDSAECGRGDSPASARPSVTFVVPECIHRCGRMTSANGVGPTLIHQAAKGGSSAGCRSASFFQDVARCHCRHTIRHRRLLTEVKTPAHLTVSLAGHDHAARLAQFGGRAVGLDASVMRSNGARLLGAHDHGENRLIVVTGAGSEPSGHVLHPKA